jgi:putative ABC transport system permease protein
MPPLTRELHHGLRSLLRSPTFTTVAVATLALGIGANTAIFSVLDAVVLRPLPYPDSDQLVLVWGTTRGDGQGGSARVSRGQVSPAEFFDWRDRVESFQQMAAFMFWSFNLSGEGEPESVVAGAVVPSLFPLLEVAPLRGRGFTEEEAVVGRGNVVILSYGLWQRRFGGADDVLGRRLTLNDEAHTVVGVMPRGFAFPHEEVELWVPMAFNPQGAGFERPVVMVLGRLRDGVGIEQAQREMDLVTERLRRENPGRYAGRGAEVVSLLENQVGGIEPVLVSLLAAVGAVLLIACVNVANLLLARGLAREKDYAIRKALGARRLELLRQPFLESLMLAFAGGALGLPLALWGVRALTALSPAELPRVDQAGLDPRVLGFTLGVSLVAGVIFGLLPVFQVTRGNPRQLYQEGRLRGGAGRSGASHLLIVSEVALALCLLSATGLILRSLGRLEEVPRGFSAEDLLVTQLILPDSKYQGYHQVTFYEQLLEKLRGLPGVLSVGAVSALPMNPTPTDFDVPFTIEGRPLAEDTALPQAHLRIATAGYFETLGIPLADGRTFTAADRPGQPRVAMVNRRMADRYWPGQSPLGQRLRIHFQGERHWEIVGVVEDVRHYGAARDPVPEIFLPFPQMPLRALAVVVRTSGDPLARVDAVKSAVWELDPAQPLARVVTMEQLLGKSLARERFQVLLLGAFALTALVLAAVGIHGVMSQAVLRRTREIGLRMALGADAKDLVALIVGRALLLTGVGIVCGAGITLALAYALGPWVSRFLHQISPADPLTYVAAAALLGAVAFLGAYLPARRATKVDPMISLRAE